MSKRRSGGRSARRPSKSPMANVAVIVVVILVILGCGLAYQRHQQQPPVPADANDSGEARVSAAPVAPVSAEAPTAAAAPVEQPPGFAEMIMGRLLASDLMTSEGPLTPSELASAKALLRPAWEEAAWIRPHRRMAWAEYYTGDTFAAADMQRIIDEAVAAGKREITIPPGIYRAPPQTRGAVMVMLNQIENLTIIADDVFLIGQSVNRFLGIKDCRNVTLRGLVMDNAPESLPFTQGTIVSLADDGKTAEVEIHAGYPMPSNTDGVSRKAEQYDADSLLLSEGTPTKYNVRYEPTGEGRRIRVAFEWPDGSLRVGNYLVLLNRELMPHGLCVEHSDAIRLEGIKMHCAPMFSILSVDSADVHFDGIEITPGPMLPGSSIPRIQAGNQDGIHIIDMRGSGDVIENSIIECHSDDAIAVNSGYSLVVKKDGDACYVTSKYGNTNLSAGIEVDHTRMHDMQMTGRSQLATVELVTDQALEAELKALTADLIERNKIREAGFNRFWRVSFASGAPGAEEEFLSLASGNHGLQVRNNFIANHRARSMLLKTSGAVVEDNVVFHSKNTCVVMSPEKFWAEAGYSRDMTLRRNTFIDCGYGWGNPHTSSAGMISIHGGNAAAGNHRNITITDNTFIMCFSMPLVVTAASDVTVTGNRFRYTHFHRSDLGKNQGIDQAHIMWLKNAANVRYTGNRLERVGELLGDDPVQATNVTGLQVD